MNILDVLWLMEETVKAKWRKVRYIKTGRRLNWISTEDLDSNNKLFPDYKERRKRRKEKRNKSKAFESIDLDELF